MSETPTEIQAIDEVISAAERAREACEGTIIEQAKRIRDLEDRILLAKRLNYANYPGFVNPALNGEAIPQDILEYTDRICTEEGYVSCLDK